MSMVSPSARFIYETVINSIIPEKDHKITTEWGEFLNE